MAGQAQTDNLAAMFADLDIELSDTPLPEPRRGGAQAGPNPFADMVAATLDAGKPAYVYLPPKAVQRGIFLINSAARKANLGVRVVPNVKRDDTGKIVKGADGKVQYLIESKGANRGKVLVGFQARAERKQNTTPRPFSLLRDKTDESGNTWIVRDRATKATLFTGNRDDAKADYEARKLRYLTAWRAEQAAKANAEQAEAPA